MSHRLPTAAFVLWLSISACAAALADDLQPTEREQYEQIKKNKLAEYVADESKKHNQILAALDTRAKEIAAARKQRPKTAELRKAHLGKLKEAEHYLEAKREEFSAKRESLEALRQSGDFRPQLRFDDMKVGDIGHILDATAVYKGLSLRCVQVIDNANMIVEPQVFVQPFTVVGGKAVRNPQPEYNPF